VQQTSINCRRTTCTPLDRIETLKNMTNVAEQVILPQLEIAARREGNLQLQQLLPLDLWLNESGYFHHVSLDPKYYHNSFLLCIFGQFNHVRRFPSTLRDSSLYESSLIWEQVGLRDTNKVNQLRLRKQIVDEGKPKCVSLRL